MFRTNTCGELRIQDAGNNTTLAGWVQRVRNLGGMTFIDLRDRYGITQLVFNMETDGELCEKARKLGREFVIQVKGTVAERSNKNKELLTGEIEVITEELKVLNEAKVPPFTIEDISDGGDELRMKYRYLDLRRNPLKKNLLLRHRLAQATRKYLDEQGFLEIETPFLIKSTPEGARDFVVPSRVHTGEFYALPQSPQTFKQLLMVSGYDRYFQIVRCFRDEDLRADRQPEFTQIDCEMAFVDQEDILQTFEGLLRHLIMEIKGVDLGDVPRISYEDAMSTYGSDKPDIRFGMPLIEITKAAQGKGFPVFDEAEAVIGINISGAAEYTRKQIDELIDWVKRPQIGAKGMVWVKNAADGSIKSSVDKFYDEQALRQWAQSFQSQLGDLMLILAGKLEKTRKMTGDLRLEMARRLGLRNPNEFKALWVIDFPLMEFDDETLSWNPAHHPFTAPKAEHFHLLETDLGAVKANAYDFVLNGNEIAGGSIRIYDRKIQETIFRILGLTEQEAEEKFGFLLKAFEYGAPPHGGIAFGFDRLCAILAGSETIRDFIAFPKNNAGRDVMLNAPASIDQIQLSELHLDILPEEKNKFS